VQRTQGGAGLILSEATLISQQGTEWAHAPGLWSDEQVAGWKTITDAVHAHGGTIFAQLAHVGRLAHPDMPEHIASGKASLRCVGTRAGG
jgi:2,4-dienoyl-CoA reductase-like NADH-dependent reductase (Old Yellow Enzyme family)